VVVTGAAVSKGVAFSGVFCCKSKGSSLLLVPAFEEVSRQNKESICIVPEVQLPSA